MGIGIGLCAKCSHNPGVKSEEVKFNGFLILERFNELKGKESNIISCFALSTNRTCSSISQQIKQIIQIIERGRPFNSNITFCANPQKPFVARFLRKWKYRIFDHIVTIIIVTILILIRILGSICLYWLKNQGVLSAHFMGWVMSKSKNLLLWKARAGKLIELIEPIGSVEV